MPALVPAADTPESRDSRNHEGIPQVRLNIDIQRRKSSASPMLKRRGLGNRREFSGNTASADNRDAK